MSDTPSGAIQRAEQRRAARKAIKQRGKWGGKSYSQLVHSYFQSPQYAKLSPRAVKLLVDLMSQYRGMNNGDLTTAWTVMQAYGWRSKDLLKKAAAELEARGWIVKTRQGSIHAATLWALTFFGIDDCRTKEGNRKLDSGIKPDTMPLHLWRLPSYSDAAIQGSKRRFKNKSPARLSGKAFPSTGGADPEQGAKVVNFTPHLSRVSG